MRVRRVKIRADVLQIQRNLPERVRAVNDAEETGVARPSADFFDWKDERVWRTVTCCLRQPPHLMEEACGRGGKLDGAKA